MAKLDYFIDSHCHMFTIADIPICKPLELVVGKSDNIGTYGLLAFSIFARAFINPEKKLQHYMPYIKYFENESLQNVDNLSNEVLAALDEAKSSGYPIETDNVVLTPLIMDFDLGASVTKLRAQADRLVAAIGAKDNRNVKILPFLGIHPGRTDADTLINRYKVTSVANRGGYKLTNNGDFVGIKLYPALGFDAYPDSDPQLRASYLSFYKKLANMEIPVTVHCQKSSFELTKNAEEFTRADNWELVFAGLSDSEANKLRINFAHFGGEDGVKRTVWFQSKDENQLNFYSDNAFNKIRRDSWTYSIVKMIKKYRNAYADISAFDFTDQEAVPALHWLLYKDSQGLLVEDDRNYPYKLEDKLLWGSDYPMILNSDMASYSALLRKFITSFDFTGRKKARFEYPAPDPSMNQNVFLKKLFCDNPKKFLFDTV